MLIETAELAACELSMTKKELKWQEDDLALIRQQLIATERGHF